MTICPVHGDVELVTEEIELGVAEFEKPVRRRIISYWSCGCFPALYETYEPNGDVARWYDEGGSILDSPGPIE